MKFLIENIEEKDVKYLEDYIIKYKNRNLGVF